VIPPVLLGELLEHEVAYRLEGAGFVDLTQFEALRRRLSAALLRHAPPPQRAPGSTAGRAPGKRLFGSRTLARSVYTTRVPRTPGWVWEMHRQYFRYAIPFTFGPARARHSTTNIHGATCVAVQLNGSQFLISAHHVVAPAVAAASSEGARCLAGNVPIELTTSTADLRRADLDIATVRFPAETIPKLESDGYHVIRPVRWPPSTLSMGDPILTAGYPGRWRLQVSTDTMDFLATTKLGLVQHLGDHQFVCQLDPEYVDEASAEPSAELRTLADDELPGMSGGPALLVRREKILTPHLCGILKQGWALGDRNRLLYFARLEAIRPDGTITP
jgi:Trypsin-like peptidase domain